jgi:hypothetical protein
MKWTITKDKIDNGDAIGTGNFKGDAKTLPHLFRLLDGDSEVYYEGRSDDNNSEAAFRPLDWAMPYAGCTSIQYRNGNSWETQITRATLR